MKTIKEIWEDYASKCYPEGMAEDQEKQIKQAFYAGVFAFMTELQSAADAPEDEGVDYMEARYEECKLFFFTALMERVS